MPPVQNAQFTELLTLSAALGKDMRRTQGAGGNTSIKIDGTLWVKASGTWLAHALDKDIMVPVEITPLVAALHAGDPRAEKATDFVINDLNASGLRPSIETSVHAVIPQAVVAHFHCVNTIALSVLEQGEATIAERMAKDAPGLTWAMIPYRRPGTPLANAIAEVVDKRPDVLVLRNHGIVIMGDTVRQVAERIETVTAALSLPQREPMPVDAAWLETVSSGTAFAPAKDRETHATALDRASLGIALSGSLYPDHVIFLGTTIGQLKNDDTVAGYLAEASISGRPAPKMIVVAGKGVLLSSELTAGGEAMARCLAEVVTRVPEDEDIDYLTSAQEYELSNWEAEQYRQALDRKGTAG